MDNLSYIEAYFISALGTLKNPDDIEPLLSLLLGVYACQWLGRFETTKKKNVLKDIQTIQENNTLFILIDRLKHLGVFDVDKTTPFPNLGISRITTKGEIRFTTKKLLPKKVLSEYRKMILSSFSHTKKKSKYEVRFFWPSSSDPEIYDPHGFIFNPEEYAYKITKDKYIFGSNKNNIKIRDDELQVKEYIENIESITHFKKKKVIKFPLKKKNLEKILQQKLHTPLNTLETPQELLQILPELLGVSCVEIPKERYIRKLPDHTKIEIGLVTIQNKAWETLCVESKNVETVLALSLLVNQKNAEKLSYEEFLRKYGPLYFGG